MKKKNRGLERIGMYLTLITLSLPTELGLRVVNRVSFTALTAHEIWIILLIFSDPD